MKKSAKTIVTPLKGMPMEDTEKYISQCAFCVEMCVYVLLSITVFSEALMMWLFQVFKCRQVAED